MLAWKNWFHCSGNTYGTWLYGDPRGFRTRHHREHVEGDYRNPPPAGLYDDRCEQSRSSMQFSPLTLTRDQRRVACSALAEALLHHQVEIIDLCVCSKHWHLLARFWALNRVRTPGREPRRIIGLAKTWSSNALRRFDPSVGARVWGARSWCSPIAEAKHFENVKRYISNHLREGAAVWSVMRKGA